MPSTILSDNGVSSGSAGLKTTAASDGSLALQTTTAGGTATTAVTIDTSQNVGVGVTPSAWSLKALQVSGASIFGYTALNANIGANFYYDGSANKYIANGAAELLQLDAGAFKFFNAASGTAGNAITFTQAMTLDASGNLVVGTTTALSSSAGRIDFTLNGASSGGIISFGTGGVRKGYIYQDSTDFTIANEVSGAMRFINNGSERARIDSSGTLLIGRTTSPSIADAKVAIGGTGDTAYQLTKNGVIAARLMAVTSGLAFGVDGVDGTTERARIDSSGNLLVGTTTSSDTSGVGVKIGYSTATPWVTTTVNTSSGGAGTYHLYNVNATYTGYRFYVGADGGIRNYSGNNVNLSDERTKTNIEVSGGYLDKICAIPVKLFNYKDEAEGEQRTLGVIAQDVEAVAPELVDQDGWLGEAPEGEAPLKSIYTTDMMFALMKAIQEQQAIITQLKARLDAANL